ncbi:MAG: putative toxin-antitoxin system toxin component, PIN family [Betaproteobacteria bacterium]|nr:putative toxin-antitoxin system toxin component, PIN family [Betaproteobacteria bacterium]MCL2885862.1 putative toxin-antitoxin system toxin component, PIN family [Betaproteobacteria bacterium]
MPPRVVLDTNIVLSALVFGSGRLAWVRQAWQRQQLRPLVCRESVSELLRVLAYPKFRLTAREQQDLLGDFLHHAEAVALPAQWPELPACRDSKDQVFLVLAQVARADALVSGDADILALRNAFTGRIWTADELAAELGLH